VPKRFSGETHVKGIDTPLAIIGLEREELRWLRTLVYLLRHPDPSVPELARQALLYLTGAAEERYSSRPNVDESYPLGELGDEQHHVDTNLVS
jgi:hypothetical protein